MVVMAIELQSRFNQNDRRFLARADDFIPPLRKNQQAPALPSGMNILGFLHIVNKLQDPGPIKEVCCLA